MRKFAPMTPEKAAEYDKTIAGARQMDISEFLPDPEEEQEAEEEKKKKQSSKPMVYGYARVSTEKQRIQRQIKNITARYPDAVIYEETYTGTKVDGRKALKTLVNRVKKGDTIVFDEVSRMSRNAEEGFELYQMLYQRGVELVFLKEPHINTSVCRDAFNRRIEIDIQTGRKAVDKLVSATIDNLNTFLLSLVYEQIKLAFDQAQSEVSYLRNRTREGMKAADAAKKISDARTGKRFPSQKEKEAKETILRHNKQFGGSLKNEETWTLAGISRTTFYKYVREIRKDEVNYP